MRVTLMAAAALAIGAPAAAQDFTTGPVFEGFGPVADIPDADFAIPEDASFHVAFVWNGRWIALCVLALTLWLGMMSAVI